MRIAPLLALSLVACKGAPTPPSLALTSGVAAPISGCPYAYTTPAKTAAPVKDDGTVGAAPTPKNLHLAWVGPPTTTITITWETDFATRGTVVEYGPTQGYGTKVPG